MGRSLNQLPPQSEHSFQDQVLGLAKYCHWKRAHFRPAQTQTGRWLTPVQADGKGFPDLVLVRRGRVIFAELKAQGGRPTPEQVQWLEALRECPGIEVYLWRPADWDLIERLLA